MKSLRSLVAGLAAAAIATPVLVSPVLAQSCVPAVERSAFDVRALQSQLMVAAIACQQEDAYNRFVRQFQRDLGDSFKSVQGHFRRVGGGQRGLDGYITNLANIHSQEGIRQGSFFCRDVTPLFGEALARTDRGALAQLAVDRNIPTLLESPACAAAAPAPARTPARRAGRTVQASAGHSTATR